jgi:hypothetical protein
VASVLSGRGITYLRRFCDNYAKEAGKEIKLPVPAFEIARVDEYIGDIRIIGKKYQEVDLPLSVQLTQIDESEAICNVAGNQGQAYLLDTGKNNSIKLPVRYISKTTGNISVPK